MELKITIKTFQRHSFSNNGIMRKLFFKALANINKVILPRYSQRNLTQLKKWEQAIIAYRYWVTINALD